MKKDRDFMFKLLKNFLKDDIDLTNTTKFIYDIDRYIDGVRAETIGWMYADVCVSLDNGEDYRKIELPYIYECAKSDLNKG